MDTLAGLSSGVFVVTTTSGTRHVVDLGRQSVRRYGAAGHEWGPTSVPDGVSDGEEFFYTQLRDAALGQRMYLSRTGGYLDADLWRITSTIIAIEPYVAASEASDQC